MKKILILIVCLLLNSCVGYEPILSGKNMKFYIGEILDKSGNDINKKIIKKLQPYKTTDDTDNFRIDLEIQSSEIEKTISKDSKGDPLIFEKIIQINLVVLKGNEKNILNYEETFIFNNQSNKFELNQYKNNIDEIMINKIFEQMIIDMN